MLSINSTEFSIAQQPDGLKELTHRVYFSDELGGYLEEFSGDLTFTGADYNYLRRRFFLDGCAVVPVTLVDSCGLSLNGNLFLNEAEWRPDICAMTVQVVDAGFLSLIDNNKGIKFFLNVPRSKNDVDISAFTVVQTDLEFKPANLTGGGSTPAINRSGVRVYDALKYLCAAMSDGLIEFESDYFNPINDPDSPRIPTLITADEVRNGRGADALFPYISFEDLFKDIRALYNVGFVVINGVMRVEPIGYFAQNLVSQTFDNPDEIRQSADDKSFYANVKFGYTSDSVKDYDYYPNATFAGFSKEQYHLGGQCNTKNDLDLQLNAIIADPNVIMLSLPDFAGGQPNADYNEDEDDIYIVVFDSNNETVQYGHPIDSNKIYYNKPLQNFEVANRWGDGVPFPIYLFLGQSNNFANGMLTLTDYVYNSLSVARFVMGETLFGQVPLIAALNCNDDTFPNGEDPNGLYSVTNATPHTSNPGPFPSPSPQTASRYTAPFNAVYTVRFTGTIWAINTHTGDFGGYGVSFQLFNSANVFQSETYFPASSQPPAPEYGTGANNWNISATFFMLAGDYVIVTVFDPYNFSSNPSASQETEVLVIPGARFIIEDPLGGTWKTYDPNDNLLIETSFEYPTAPETWLDFLNQRFGTFTVTHPNGRVRGFLKEANRNLHTGKTDWVLRSNFGDS